MTTDDGEKIVINAAADCDLLSDGWLADWCRNVAAFDPGIIPAQMADLPKDLYGKAWTDFDQHVQAALAWALINDNGDLCGQPVIDAYFAVGSHATDGAAVW